MVFMYYSRPGVEGGLRKRKASKKTVTFLLKKGVHS
jgi:hypothetical protein